ncbi:unnamed protein product, partial [Owenia fusiformis]
KLKYVTSEKLGQTRNRNISRAPCYYFTFICSFHLVLIPQNISTMSGSISSTTNSIYLVLFSQIISQAFASYCEAAGKICSGSEYCCTSGCCMYRYHYTWSVWNMWYFWFIIIFVLMSCFGGCGYWKRRQWMMSQQRAHMQANAHQQTTGQPMPGMPVYPYVYDNPYATTETTAPPQGAFPTPPAYSEVISKPNQFPGSKTDLPPYPGFTQAPLNTVSSPGPVAGPPAPPPYAATPTVQATPQAAPTGPPADNATTTMNAVTTTTNTGSTVISVNQK